MIIVKKQIKGSIYLLIATIIWGSAFVAQSVGMDHIGPFTFQAVRSALSLIAMFPVICLMDKGKTKWSDKKLWRTGILCGIALFAASGLQQMGLVYTDAGKAGFLTAMYIVLVPILGLFCGRRVSGLVWVSIIVAVAGLYLLCGTGMNSLNIGDLLLIGCAGAFAVQITLVDRFGLELDGLKLNFVQFLVNAVLSAITMLLTETPQIPHIVDCAVPLLYTGVLSSAVAYSLQILGQQHLPPAPASLIMSLESVFAVLSGWLLLNETMTTPELLGCCLVFLAVVLSQLPSKKI